MHSSTATWVECRYSQSWRHSAGLSVFVDPIPTKSGAIRLVGPIGSGGSRLRLQGSLVLISELTAVIENNAANLGRYVCWGTFRQNHPNNLHELSLLGKGHYFTPNLALRSTLLLKNRFAADLVSREWWLDQESNEAVHRAGIRIRFETLPAGLDAKPTIEIVDEKFDGALFHDQYFRETIELMADNALKLLRKQSLEIRS